MGYIGFGTGLVAQDAKVTITDDDTSVAKICVPHASNDDCWANEDWVFKAISEHNCGYISEHRWDDGTAEYFGYTALSQVTVLLDHTEILLKKPRKKEQFEFIYRKMVKMYNMIREVQNEIQRGK